MKFSQGQSRFSQAKLGKNLQIDVNNMPSSGPTRAQSVNGSRSISQQVSSDQQAPSYYYVVNIQQHQKQAKQNRYEQKFSDLKNKLSLEQQLQIFQQAGDCLEDCQIDQWQMFNSTFECILDNQNSRLKEFSRFSFCYYTEPLVVQQPIQVILFIHIQQLCKILAEANALSKTIKQSHCFEMSSQFENDSLFLNDKIMKRLVTAPLRYGFLLLIMEDLTPAADLACANLSKLEQTFFAKGGGLMQETVTNLVNAYLLAVLVMDALTAQQKPLHKLFQNVKGRPIRSEFLMNAQKVAMKYLTKEFQQQLNTAIRIGQGEIKALVAQHLEIEYMLDAQFQLRVAVCTSIENRHVNSDQNEIREPSSVKNSRLILRASRKQSIDEGAEARNRGTQQERGANLLKVEEANRDSVPINRKVIESQEGQLQKELEQCRNELTSLRSQFLNEKKLKLEVQEKMDKIKEHQAIDVKKMQQQIQQMEGVISQLRGQQQMYVKEMKFKDEEVEELKSQLNDINEQQKKLEKLVEIQNSQQQTWIAQQQQYPVSTANHIKSQGSSFSKANKQQSTQSLSSLPQAKEIEDDKSIQAPRRRTINRPKRLLSDEDVQNQRNPHLMIDLEQFEVGVSFSKWYRVYQGKGWDCEFSETQCFRIQASISIGGEGRTVLLQAFMQDQLVATESLNQEMISYLTTNLELNDVCPSNMVIRGTNSTHHFFKFVLLPFVVVSMEDTNYKLQVWPKAPGTLSGLMLKTDFLGQNCLVFVHFIEFDHFRVVLCDPFGLESVRFDIEMDYSTLDYFFSGVRFVKDEFTIDRLEQLKSMANHIEARKLDGDLFEGMELLQFDRNKFQQHQDVKTAFEFENMHFTKTKEFTNFLWMAILQVEELVKRCNKASFNGQTSSYMKIQAMSGLKYLKYKTWNNGTKGQAQMVNDLAQSLEIYLSNTHETCGPDKSKIRVHGNRQYTHQQIKRDFSIDYTSLTSEEQVILCHLALFQFSLNVFDKAIEQTVAQFDYNPIIHTQLECGAYQRFVVDSGTNKTPVTISVVGAGRRILGVKITVLDIEDCMEHGVFLNVTPNDWDLRGSTKIYKTKASVQNIPYSEHIVTQVCWDPLFKELLTNRYMTIESLKTTKPAINKLEYVLNPTELAKI